MIIQTGELGEREQRYTGEESVSILDLENDSFVRGEDAIHYDLTAHCLNDEMLVRGKLAVELICLCSRCADWFHNILRVPDFVRSYVLSSENEAIDLTGDMREDILLALPMNSVCSSECRGLCPGCGVNLNKQACACHPGKPPAAWNVLDQLTLT